MDHFVYRCVPAVVSGWEDCDGSRQVQLAMCMAILAIQHADLTTGTQVEVCPHLQP